MNELHTYRVSSCLGLVISYLTKQESFIHFFFQWNALSRKNNLEYTRYTVCDKQWLYVTAFLRDSFLRLKDSLLLLKCKIFCAIIFKFQIILWWINRTIYLLFLSLQMQKFFSLYLYQILYYSNQISAYYRRPLINSASLDEVTDGPTGGRYENACSLGKLSLLKWWSIC